MRGIVVAALGLSCACVGSLATFYYVAPKTYSAPTYFRTAAVEKGEINCVADAPRGPRLEMKNFKIHLPRYVDGPEGMDVDVAEALPVSALYKLLCSDAHI